MLLFAGRAGPGRSKYTVSAVTVRYKMSTRVWEYNSVTNALRWAGLQKTNVSSLANLYWGRHLPPDVYSGLKSYQKVNHFPGTWCIGRKDRLATNLMRSRRVHGSKV